MHGRDRSESALGSCADQVGMCAGFPACGARGRRAAGILHVRRPHPMRARAGRRGRATDGGRLARRFRGLRHAVPTRLPGTGARPGVQPADPVVPAQPGHPQRFMAATRRPAAAPVRTRRWRWQRRITPGRMPFSQGRAGASQLAQPRRGPPSAPAPCRAARPVIVGGKAEPGPRCARRRSRPGPGRRRRPDTRATPPGPRTGETRLSAL
jgi:hypothetical protein